MFAGAAFFFAFFGLVGLFALKRWEYSHERILFPEMRRKVDEGALRLKALMLLVLQNIATLPRILMYLARMSIHLGASAFGHLAHWIGERSHALADLVSHKHRFEHREPRSEFLKKVIEHPISNRLPDQAHVPHEPAPAIGHTIDALITPSVFSDIEPAVPRTDPISPSPVKKKRKRRIGKKSPEHTETPVAEDGLDR